MPKIGCGLDLLDQKKVSAMIQRVFGEMDITITVYCLDQVKPEPKGLSKDLGSITKLDKLSLYEWPLEDQQSNEKKFG